MGGVDRLLDTSDISARLKTISSMTAWGPVVLSASTFAATLPGGLFALRYRAWLDVILGFTAGVLLGVVAFDVLPEIFATARENGANADDAMIALVLSFLLFRLPAAALVVYLGVFAGVLLYIAAVDALPFTGRSITRHPAITALPILGAAVIYLAVHIIAI